MDNIYAQVDKMNKKAKKLGLPDIRVQVLESGRGSSKVRIVGNAPFIKGWEMIAKLMPVTDDSGNSSLQIVSLSSTGNALIPPQILQSQARCDECKEQRARNHVYLMLNEETGEYKMIGTSCLGRFVQDDSNTPAAIAKYAEQMRQMVTLFKNHDIFADKAPDQIRKIFKDQGVPIDFFLSKVLEAEREMGGFMGKKEAWKAGKQPTVDTAWTKCISDIQSGKPTDPALTSP
jgi:hypothetical protein